MCHPSDYEHLMTGGPAVDAPLPPEPTWLAGFPMAEEADAYARTLVFGQRGRVACERPSFDPYWCIVHSHDFADGAGACEAAR